MCGLSMHEALGPYLGARGVRERPRDGKKISAKGLRCEPSQGIHIPIFRTCRHITLFSRETWQV